MNNQGSSPSKNTAVSTATALPQILTVLFAANKIVPNFALMEVLDPSITASGYEHRLRPYRQNGRKLAEENAALVEAFGGSGAGAKKGSATGIKREGRKGKNNDQRIGDDSEEMTPSKSGMGDRAGVVKKEATEHVNTEFGSGDADAEAEKEEEDSTEKPRTAKKEFMQHPNKKTPTGSRTKKPIFGSSSGNEDFADDDQRGSSTGIGSEHVHNPQNAPKVGRKRGTAQVKKGRPKKPRVGTWSDHEDFLVGDEVGMRGGTGEDLSEGDCDAEENGGVDGADHEV